MPDYISAESMYGYVPYDIDDKRTGGKVFPLICIDFEDTPEHERWYTLCGVEEGWHISLSGKEHLMRQWIKQCYPWLDSDKTLYWGVSRSAITFVPKFHWLTYVMLHGDINVL